MMIFNHVLSKVFWSKDCLILLVGMEMAIIGSLDKLMMSLMLGVLWLNFHVNVCWHEGLIIAHNLAPIVYNGQ
jgi:hypothetical protein